MNDVSCRISLVRGQGNNIMDYSVLPQELQLEIALHGLAPPTLSSAYIVEAMNQINPEYPWCQVLEIAMARYQDPIVKRVLNLKSTYPEIALIPTGSERITLRITSNDEVLAHYRTTPGEYAKIQYLLDPYHMDSGVYPNIIPRHPVIDSIRQCNSSSLQARYPASMDGTMLVNEEILDYARTLDPWIDFGKIFSRELLKLELNQLSNNPGDVIIDDPLRGRIISAQVLFNGISITYVPRYLNRRYVGLIQASFPGSNVSSTINRVLIENVPDDVMERYAHYIDVVNASRA